jgi:hypothetical protein
MSTISCGTVEKRPTKMNLHVISKIAEWVGAALGVLGALMLAANVSWSGYGWLAFLASNLAWIGYAVIKRVRSLLLMQFVFITTSLIGIVRWLV